MSCAAGGWLPWKLGFRAERRTKKCRDAARKGRARPAKARCGAAIELSGAPRRCARLAGVLGVGVFHAGEELTVRKVRRRGELPGSRPTSQTIDWWR